MANTSQKWTSIKRVLSKVADTLPTEFFDEVDILEWASEAVEKLAVFNTLQHNVCLLQVREHITFIPKGLVQIEMAAYKENFLLTEEDVEDIKSKLEKLTGTSSDIFFNSYINDTKKDWKPLRLANSPFAAQYHCATSPNVTCECEHKYRLHHNGKITTSFKDGWISLAYMSYPIDKCGDFLIPDDADYIDAVSVYCMWKVWERRWNMQMEGASERMRYYIGRWEIMYPKVVGAMNDPSLDEYENIRTMRNRFVPKEERFNSFFGNLSSQESLNMNGNFNNHYFINNLSNNITNV